jgi:hypothetical protein
VAICFIAGFLAAIRRRRVLLLWLLLAMIPAVFATESPHALRAMLMLPAVCLLAAMGAGEIGARLPRKIAPCVATAMIFWLVWEPYNAYFRHWAIAPQTAAAFDQPSSKLARRILALPPTQIKWIVWTDLNFPVRGEPVELQPLMFLTTSFTEQQRERNRIHYVNAWAPFSPSPGDAVFRFPQSEN